MVYFHYLTVVGADTTPPIVIACPDSITNTIPFGTTSLSVTWTEPTATDNTGVMPSVTQSHQSGDEFSVGATNVTYTFTDEAGNEAMCVFTVTIGK